MKNPYPERGYTTFVYEEEKRPDVFEFLKLHLDKERAAAGGRNVYLLGIAGDHRTVLDMPLPEHIKHVLYLTDTTGFIVVGDHALVEKTANDLSQKIGASVGLVRYEGQDSSAILYLDLCTAMRHAQKRTEPFRFYNPAVDSFDAILRNGSK